MKGRHERDLGTVVQLHAHTAVRVDEVHEVDDPAVAGFGRRRGGDLHAGIVELHGERLHALRRADLPADVGDVLGVARVHREAMVVAVHLQEQRLRVAVVCDLVTEHAGCERAPLVEVACRDPDVAELVNLRHLRVPH